MEADNGNIMGIPAVEQSEQIKRMKLAQHFKAKIFKNEKLSIFTFPHLRENWAVYFSGTQPSLPFSVTVGNEVVEFDVRLIHENTNDPQGILFKFMPKEDRRRKLAGLTGKYVLEVLKRDGTIYRRFDSPKIDWLSTSWDYPHQDVDIQITELYLTRNEILHAENEILGENDTLTLHLTFISYSSQLLEYPNAYRLEKEVTMETENALSKDMGFLLEDKQDTDFVIKTSDGIEFHAHKLILKSRVGMFRAMFETDMLERSTGTMETPDISSGSMKILLHYIYTGTLHQDWKKWRQLVNEVINGAKQYGLEGLIQYYDRMLITLCNDVDAEDLLQVANLHGLKGAEEDIGKWIRGISAD